MSDGPVPTPLASPRFSRYPEYRDSGVEWLGEIPVHWEVGRLKKTVSECQNGVWGEDPDGTNDIACVRVADFDRDTFSVDVSSLTLRHVNPRALSKHGLRVGDLLLEKSGGGDRQPVGAVVILANDLPAVCSNFIARMPVNDGYSPVFLVYLHAALYSNRINVRSIKQSIGIQNLDSGSYLNELVGLPPLDEQYDIARFLDRETAKVDSLVAKQQELIRLLQEKRTALVNHAVMKGLDPDVAMKDSGVVWLGEIPVHWEVGRLKETVCKCQNGVWGEDPDGTNDIACVRVADFDRDTFSVDVSSLTLRHVDPKALSTHRLRVGDLLLEKSGGGERQPVGAVVILANDLSAVCSNFIARMRVNDGYSPVFLVYLHAALYSNRINVRSIKQSIGIQNLDSGSYLNELVGLPPIDEQYDIARFLDCEAAAIDELVAKANDAIDRLNEYRTALISAAVTGKIDVRRGLPSELVANTDSAEEAP